MRNLLLLLILFTAGYMPATQAQTASNGQYIDVLYLNDGTVVKGEIVYIVPQKQVNIKIKDRRTEEERVKTYQMSEISRMTKENINAAKRSETGVAGAVTQSNSASNSSLNNPMRKEFNQPLMQTQNETMQLVAQPVRADVEKPTIIEGPNYLDGARSGSDDVDMYDMYRRLNRINRQWDRDIKGMRVFTDYVYGHGTGDVKNNYLGWGNSIGYQSDPHFYIGIGLQYNISLNKKESTLPIFINPRINFIDNKVTPYFDMKAGYSMASAKGIYLNPSAGVSIALKGTSAIEFGIGYSYQGAKWNTRDKNDVSRKIKMNQKYNSIMLKVTYSITFWKF